MSSVIKYTGDASGFVENEGGPLWVHTQRLASPTAEWEPIDACCLPCLAWLLHGYPFWGVTGLVAIQVQQQIDTHHLIPLRCARNNQLLGTT
jgi:hypothetical protein